MLEVRSPRTGAAFNVKILKTGASAETAYIRADGLGRPSAINMGYNFTADGASVVVAETYDNPAFINDVETAAGLTWIPVGTAAPGAVLTTQNVPTGFRFEFSAPSVLMATCS